MWYFSNVLQSCLQSDEVDNQNGCLSAVFNVVYSFELLLLAVLVVGVTSGFAGSCKRKDGITLEVIYSPNVIPWLLPSN